MKTFITLILSLVLFWGCSPSNNSIRTQTTVAAGNVNRPTIAIDSTTGTVYVAWVGKKDSTSNVYLARLEQGQSHFVSPVRVNHVIGRANSHSQAPPQVSVSPTGLVYIAWINLVEVEGRRWPASNILVARSKDGGRTFSKGVEVAINKPAYPTGQHFHDIAVGPNGAVYVSWLDSRAGNHPVEETSTQAAEMSEHDMQGMHHMAGMQMSHDVSTMQVRVAKSVNHAESFKPGKIIAKHTCQCCRTAVTVGNNGNVYIAWRHIFGNSIRDIAMVQSTDGGKTFTDPIRVHKDGWKISACPHAGPSIVANGRGAVFAFWFTGADKPGIYMAKAKGKNVAFGKPILLSSVKATSQIEADMNAKGNVWFAWENYNKGIIKIGNYIDGRVNKSFATIKNGQLPSIAVTNEMMAVTWIASDSIKVRVYEL